MKFRDYGNQVSNREMKRRHELKEQHLFDNDAREERALCGSDASTEERIGVVYYLECRMGCAPVGTVCEGCKALVVPFAENRVRDLEADGFVDEAEEFRNLADTLRRETAP